MKNLSSFIYPHVFSHLYDLFSSFEHQIKSNESRLEARTVVFTIHIKCTEKSILEMML